MAFVYPLTQDQFIATLPIETLAMDLPEQVLFSQTGAGEIIPYDKGPQLWQGTIALGTLQSIEGQSAQVLIDLLRGNGRTFLAYDTRRPAPINDPRGVILGASTPVIATLPSDRRLISLSGLPAGYLLARGDYLSFTYGSSPTRYALHRLVEELVTADGTGLTAEFEVAPFVPLNATVGATVTLVKAACKALIKPGTTQTGTGRAKVYSGQSFQFIQTMG